jgi:putative ATPase
VLGPDSPLRTAIAGDRVPSLILHGPPGCGKTTLARVVAASTNAAFEELSAVSAGLADARAVIARARDRLTSGQRTVLFLDEIHRFNKAQQDALLPAVEDGLITLIGATTENPYYEVNSALISRMHVITLSPLDSSAIATMLDRAVHAPQGLADRVALEPEARDALVVRSGGDGRHALKLLEAAAAGLPDGATITPQVVHDADGRRTVVYDKTGDAHYDTISAFIKSMRASDADATVYYLAVMLHGGEDPKFIARRILIAAAEDVGNADPRALGLAGAAAHPACPGGDLRGARSQVQRLLQGDQRGAGTCGEARRPAAAQGAARLQSVERQALRPWRGVPLPARLPRRGARRVAASRGHGARALLHPHRPRRRSAARRPPAPTSRTPALTQARSGGLCSPP